VPLRQIWKTNPNQAIKGGVTMTPASRKWIFRDLLLAFQIAICCLLVTSSLVALRGLDRTLHANFGFNAKGVTLAVTDLQLAGYSGASVEQFQKYLADEVSHLPGVTAVGMQRHSARYLHLQYLSFRRRCAGIERQEPEVHDSVLQGVAWLPEGCWNPHLIVEILRRKMMPKPPGRYHQSDLR